MVIIYLKSYRTINNTSPTLSRAWTSGGASWLVMLDMRRYILKTNSNKFNTTTIIMMTCAYDRLSRGHQDQSICRTAQVTWLDVVTSDLRRIFCMMSDSLQPRFPGVVKFGKLSNWIYSGTSDSFADFCGGYEFIIVITAVMYDQWKWELMKTRSSAIYGPYICGNASWELMRYMEWVWRTGEGGSGAESEYIFRKKGKEKRVEI